MYYMADKLPLPYRLIDQYLWPLQTRASIENPNTPLTAFNLSGGSVSATGVNITHNNSTTITSVWNATQLISQSVASLPYQLFQKTDQGREHQSTHPTNILISKSPNPINTSFDLREWILMSCLLTGNGIIYIKKFRDGRRELWPVKPIKGSQTEVSLSESGMSLFYNLELYNEKVLEKIPSRDVIHVKGLGTDPFLGIDVITNFQDSLGLSKSQELYNSQYYLNGASTNGVITTDQRLTNEQYDAVKNSWQENQAGGNNHHKTPILHSGLKYNPISITPEQSQFLQSRSFAVEEIARMFNIPPHMIKDLSRSTNNNIEQQALEYSQYTILPWVTKIEAEFDKKLLTEKEKEEGFFTKMNMNGILRGDMQSRAEFYNTLVTLGIMTRNEARKLEDLNTLEGLDKPLTPLNLMPANKTENDE